MFALVLWDDENRWSVIGLANILSPRKAYEKYSIGEKVEARCPGYAGAYSATIEDLSGE